MSADAQAARDDLAYLKALVDRDGGWQASFGLIYMTAGAAYGVQCVLQWLAYAGILPIERTPAYLAVVTVPTLVWVAVIVRERTRRRKTRVANPSYRALEAVFQGVGYANLAVIASIVAAAVGLEAYAMILVYAAVIFAFQGACWLVVWRLQRKAWMLWVALGWLASGPLMGASLGGLFGLNIGAFIGIATFDLWALMALPGFVIWRAAQKEASP